MAIYYVLMRKINRHYFNSLRREEFLVLGTLYHSPPEKQQEKKQNRGSGLSMPHILIHHF